MNVIRLTKDLPAVSVLLVNLEVAPAPERVSAEAVIGSAGLLGHEFCDVVLHESAAGACFFAFKDCYRDIPTFIAG